MNAAVRRILIVDDHALIRQGLKQLLVTDSFTQVGEASTCQEALTQVAAAPWHVVILDLTLPDGNGLEVLKQIQEARPGLPVLVLTMHGEEQYAVRALRAGAAGYLTKRSAPEQLVVAIDNILRGERYISPALAEKLATRLIDDRGAALHERLSDREYQVMRLLASGRTVGEIAQELGLSVKTVSTHRSHVLDKMQMKTNSDLMRYAIHNGLIE